MRLDHKKKPALVLSGGGVKAAAFHAGVCLALNEKGFRFAGGTKDDIVSLMQAGIPASEAVLPKTKTRQISLFDRLQV